MKVVIVCLEFARMQRARSLAEGLSLAGHEVVYVTAEQGASDPLYTTVTVPFTTTGQRVKQAAGMDPAANFAVAARKRGGLAKWLVRTAAKMHEALLMHPDKYRGWISACRKWLRTDPEQLSQASVVIASSPPASVLYVGSQVAGHLGVPLIMDFRDLWTDNPYYPHGPLRRVIDRMMERRVLRTAAGFTCATKALRYQMSARRPDQPISPIYTGIDPEPWYSPAQTSPSDHLRLGHFGTTYGGLRSVRPVLESVRRLASAGQIDSARIRIEMYGHPDEQAIAHALDLNMEHSLVIHGWIPPDEVPARLAEIGVALLVTWSEDLWSVPLKSYHYLAAGKTILIVGASPDSEIRQLLEPLPGVDCPDTTEEMDATILRYWRSIEEGRSLDWTMGQRPLPVTRESMTREFLEVIESTVSA